MITLEHLVASWRRARQSAVVFGMFSTGVRVGANLLLLPVLLTRLNTSEMALWWQFVALGAFANLADFGFGPAITRVYSYLWAGAEDFDAEGLRPPPANHEPNLPLIRRLTQTVRYFYWRLSIGATLLLGIAGTFVLLRPVSADADPGTAWLAWAGQLLVIAYTLGTNRWAMACQGVGRVREVQVAYAWGGVSYVVCSAGLLLAHWGLVAMVVGGLLRAVLTCRYCMATYYSAVPKLALSDSKPDLVMLKKLWPNASKFGMVSVGAYCISYSGVLISGHFLGPKVTADFGLTAQIGTVLMGFAGLWLSVKWPQLTMLRTQGRLEEMSRLFAHRLTITMVTFICTAAAVLLIGNQLLAWKGTQTRLLPFPALAVYFLYLTQQLFYVQFGSLAYTENVVPFFKVAMYTGALVLILSFVLTWAFGLWGLLLGPLFAESVYSSWYTVRRGFSGQALRPKQFLRTAIFRIP